MTLGNMLGNGSATTNFYVVGVGPKGQDVNLHAYCLPSAKFLMVELIGETDEIWLLSH